MFCVFLFLSLETRTVIFNFRKYQEAYGLNTSLVALLILLGHHLIFCSFFGEVCAHKRSGVLCCCCIDGGLFFYLCIDHKGVFWGGGHEARYAGMALMSKQVEGNE